jgi:hypothetical protein
MQRINSQPPFSRRFCLDGTAGMNGQQVRKPEQCLGVTGISFQGAAKMANSFAGFSGMQC